MPKGVPNKRYTPELKRMVVETMKKEHLSIYAAMQEFGINDHKIIERWERIYLEEGPEGLAIERRGRSSKGRPPKQLPKQVEEDLLAEVQRLRAENDYLKNLQTSVYKGYKQDKIEMRGDRAEMSDFPLYLNTVAGGLDRRDQTIGGFSFVVKIYAVPVVEIIGQLLYLLGRYGFNAQFSDCL